MSFCIVVSSKFDENLQLITELLGVFTNTHEAMRKAKEHDSPRGVINIIEIPSIPWPNPEYQNEE